MGLSLILLRHAKSDWSVASSGDLERPLSPRGLRSAQAVGRFLASAGLLPDLALTSPALRARSTLDLAAKSGAWGCEVLVTEALYGTAGEVLAEIGSTPDRVRTLLAVGHQPAWSEVVTLLTGCGAIRLPTGSVLVLGSEAERWPDLARAGGAVELLLTPRALLGR